MSEIKLDFEIDERKMFVIEGYFANFEYYKNDNFALLVLCDSLVTEEYKFVFDGNIDYPRSVNLREITKSILKESIDLICGDKQISKKINASREVLSGIITGKITITMNLPIEVVYPVVWVIVNFSIKVPRNIFCQRYKHLLRE